MLCCIVQLHVTVNNIKMSYCTTMFLRRKHVTGINKTCFGLHVKCPVFLSDMNRTRRFSTDFPRSPQHQTFDANPSSGRRGDTCWLTDVTKLYTVGAFAGIRTRLKQVSIQRIGHLGFSQQCRQRFTSSSKLHRGKYLTTF